MKKAVIICGPTASGKTNFAHQFALRHGGEIINADSMQIYRQIPIITASPTLELKEELPYYLYNFIDASEEFSVAKYIEHASNIIKQVSNRGALPIIVGGSGMYISMLINGVSNIPNIEESVRVNARLLHQKIGAYEFFNKLHIADPQVASVLNMGDTQRVIRAYEVFMQTGKSIMHFQQQKILPLPDINFRVILLLPIRKFLYDTCNNRLAQLFKTGAIEEVKTLFEQYPDLATSSSKALGIAEIILYLKDEITKDKALELASAKTRQYAKRQCTWFNNQITDKQVLQFGSINEYEQLIKSFNDQVIPA